jgi:hypothetical protein
MSLAIIPAAYMVSTAVVLLAGAVLHHMPFLVVNLIVTVFLGFLLTYVGLPLSTRLLQAWLYPAGATERATRNKDRPDWAHERRKPVQHPLKSRSPGCSPRATTSRPSWAPSASLISKRTPPRTRSN